MAVPEVTHEGSIRYVCARLSTVQDVPYVGVRTFPIGAHDLPTQDAVTTLESGLMQREICVIQKSFSF